MILKRMLKIYLDTKERKIKNEVHPAILGPSIYILLYIGKYCFESTKADFARLHRVTSDESGFFENNVIGATPRVNLPRKKDRTEFYITSPPGYQIRLAGESGYL